VAAYRADLDAAGMFAESEVTSTWRRATVDDRAG
jgi:hypothetical protein